MQQIGKDRFNDKLVDRHDALQKQRAEALSKDESQTQTLSAAAQSAPQVETVEHHHHHYDVDPKTGEIGLPSTSAPTGASADVGTGTTVPAASSAVPAEKAKRESWGGKFSSFKNKEREAAAEKAASKGEKTGGIRGFFSGLTKRSKDKTEKPTASSLQSDKTLGAEKTPVTTNTAVATTATATPGQTVEAEEPNLSGFRDTTLPDIEASVMDGRPDEFDQSTFGGQAKAGIASAVAAVGLANDDGPPEPAHGFDASRNAASGGHEFSGVRVLAADRAEANAQPLGEVPGANSKVGATGLPAENEFGTVSGSHASNTGSHFDPYTQKQDTKLGDEVVSKLRSGQAGVGIVPDYHNEQSKQHTAPGTSENILARDARLDNTLPHKSKLDASGLPLKEYGNKDVGDLENSTKIDSSSQFRPDPFTDASLDPSLRGDVNLPATGLPNAGSQKQFGSVAGYAGGELKQESKTPAQPGTTQHTLSQDQRLDDTLPYKSKLDASGLPLKQHASRDVTDLENSTNVTTPDYSANPIADAQLDSTLPHKSKLDATGLPLPQYASGHETTGPSGHYGSGSGDAVSGDFNLKSNQIADDVTKVGNDPRFGSAHTSSRPDHELEITDAAPRTLDPGSSNAVSGDFNLTSNQIADNVTKVGNDPRFGSGLDSSHQGHDHQLDITDGPSSTGNPVSGDFNLKSNQIVDDVTKVGNDPRFTAGVGSSHPAHGHQLDITDGPSSTGNPVSGDFNLKSNEIVDDVTKVGNDPRFASGSTSGNPVSGDFNLKSNQIVDDITRVGNDPRFVSGVSAPNHGTGHELEIGDGPSPHVPGSFHAAEGDFNLKANEIAGDVSKVGDDPRFISTPYESTDGAAGVAGQVPVDSEVKTAY